MVDLFEGSQFADAQGVEDAAGGFAAGQDEVAVVCGFGDRVGEACRQSAGRAGGDTTGAVDADDGDVVRCAAVSDRCPGGVARGSL